LSEKIPEIQIVSGLAYGIDIAAHKAALENKMRTLGVVAHGLDRLYPSQHRAVALQMSENGGVLTEFISQTNPDRPNFVQRNRIIAGLCQALVVVESGAKGGALITADMAFNYDREVFAFPGRVNDNWSVGCNALIRQNKAGLITSADDLIMMMRWDQSREFNNPIQKKLFVELTEDEEKIVQIVQNNQDGVQINELTYLIPLPYSRISSILLSLEFKSVIKCLPGGLYKLC
jgi:DNA processing protein